MKKKFNTVLVKEKNSSACGVELPFNPKDIFGKVRVPVKVTINNFSFRTTIFSMRGKFWFPVNTENRIGAGISGGDKISIILEEDTEPRLVETPDELREALKKKKQLTAIWEKLSYTHQKEYVKWINDAKKEATRNSRIEKTIEQLSKKI